MVRLHDRSPADKWRTALHEAGHAYAAVKCGLKVYLATVVPDDEVGAQWMRPVSRGRVQPIPDSSCRLRRPGGRRRGAARRRPRPRGTGAAADALHVLVPGVRERQGGRGRPRRPKPGRDRGLAERLLRVGTMTGDDLADFVDGWAADTPARRAAAAPVQRRAADGRLLPIARHLAARAAALQGLLHQRHPRSSPLRGRDRPRRQGRRRCGRRACGRPDRHGLRDRLHRPGVGPGRARVTGRMPSWHDGGMGST